MVRLLHFGLLSSNADISAKLYRETNRVVFQLSNNLDDPKAIFAGKIINGSGSSCQAKFSLTVSEEDTKVFTKSVHNNSASASFLPDAPGAEMFYDTVVRNFYFPGFPELYQGRLDNGTVLDHTPVVPEIDNPPRGTSKGYLFKSLLVTDDDIVVIDPLVLDLLKGPYLEATVIIYRQDCNITLTRFVANGVSICEGTIVKTKDSTE